MEKEILTKEIAKKLMEIKGEARGVNFKNDSEYVLLKEGEQGLKKVEKELEKLGTPINYKEIKNTDFYPVGLRIISLLAIKKVLSWDDREIKKLCSFAVGVSLIIKLYMKFFYSLPKMVKMSSKIWNEYFTRGVFKVVDYDEEKKWAILRIEEFNLHPVFCCCLEGYLGNIIKMIVGVKEITCEETKCFFKGEKNHEFLVKW